MVMPLKEVLLVSKTPADNELQVVTKYLRTVTYLYECVVYFANTGQVLNIPTGRIQLTFTEDLRGL